MGMPDAIAHAPARLIEAVRQAAQPLTSAASDYDGLLELVGDARLVLLGEASHGTHEFYKARCEIRQGLELTTRAEAQNVASPAA